MGTLVTIVGPIASGKSTVAARLAERLVEQGRTVVIADVDDVATTAQGPRGAAGAVWAAGHRAHGALVAGWLATEIDVVLAVGNVYDADEQAALTASLPSGIRVLRVVLEAPVALTWDRAAGDPQRGLSRERDFHHRAHARFRELRHAIPADLVLDTAELGLEDEVDAILTALWT